MVGWTVRRRGHGPAAASRGSRGAVVLAAGVVATLVAGCGTLSSATTTASHSQVLTVAAVPGIDNATLYLAKHDGLFAKAGLDVKIVRYHQVSDAMNALTSGSADVAAGDYGSLFVAAANSPHLYKIIADGYDAAAGVMEIMTMPNSPITDPTQLANQAIGVPNTDQVTTPAGSQSSLAIAAASSVLQSDGVNLSGVRWRPMNPQTEVSALVQGKVSAILVSQPYVYLAQEHGAIELIDALSGPTSGIPLAGYFTTSSWARNNTSAVAAFRSAIYAAAADAAMPGPVQAILPRYAGLSKQEADLATIGVYPLTTITLSVQQTADLMNTEGVIGLTLNVAAMMARA